MNRYWQLDGKEYDSRQLLRAFHPNGENIVFYADIGWRNEVDLAPGFHKAVYQLAKEIGATRHVSKASFLEAQA